MKTIEERSDVAFLVNTFYAKIRKDKLLGPIFNAHVADWSEHLEKLTDFWEANLFGIPKFRGNPPAAHQGVDKNENHSISQGHFAHWLQLWFETIDENFEGQIAQKAKDRARRMSTGLYLAIWQGRPENERI